MSNLLDRFKNKEVVSFEELQIQNGQYSANNLIDVLVINQVMEANLKLPILLQTPSQVMQNGAIIIVKGDNSSHSPPSEYIRLRSILLQDRRFEFLEWDPGLPASIFRLNKEVVAAPLGIERAPGYPIRYQLVDKLYRFLIKIKIIWIVSMILKLIRKMRS